MPKNKSKGNFIRRSKRKKIVVAVSGGFDPIHPGHVRHFVEAKKLGSELVVLLNNDNWLLKKKGYVFMPQAERKEVIEGLAAVDRVLYTSHEENPEDMSVCAELLKLKPDVYANGGDRTKSNIPEVEACESIGCTMVFGVGKGGKIQSSSWLLKRFATLAAPKLSDSGALQTRKKVFGKVSVEPLSHFSCGACGKWWTVGDAPARKNEWHCPWCGEKNSPA